jgi:transposase-like protein
LLAITEKWQKYHMALKSWHDNWDNLSAYFKFSPAIRKLIYTTNPIEGFHRQIRKYTKTKGAFTSENALLKLTFCAINGIVRKWNMPIANWSATISELDLFFPKRL